MAHHLADLILQARRSQGQDHIEAESANLIIQLWSKREVVPGGVYPLGRLGAVLSVIELLQSESSPFNRASSRRSDALLASAFDGLRKLVAYGILINAKQLKEHPVHDAKRSFLTDQERLVLESINAWIKHIKAARRTRYPTAVLAIDSPKDKIRPEDSLSTDEDKTKQFFLADIDALIGTLSELRRTIEADA